MRVLFKQRARGGQGDGRVPQTEARASGEEAQILAE